MIQTEHKPIMSNFTKLGNFLIIVGFSASPANFFLAIVYGIIFGILWAAAEMFDLKENLVLDDDMRFLAKCDQRMNLDKLNFLMKKIAERGSS